MSKHIRISPHNLALLMMILKSTPTQTARPSKLVKNGCDVYILEYLDLLSCNLCHFLNN